MATITVNYDSGTGTYYLTNDSGTTIPGQSLINTIKGAGERAATLGDVVYSPDASKALINQSSGNAAATANATDTPPADNTGNNNNAPVGSKENPVELPTVTVTASRIGAAPTFLGPYPNPLSQFPDYTYGVTLWMLTPNDYNMLMDDPVLWTPSKQSGVIAASGGKFTDSGQYRRLMPYFDLDFYIENLKINSSASATSKGKGSTNSLKMSMTIQEPMGITFVDRITLAAFDVSGGATHTQIPYMLEIDFFGADKTYTMQPGSLGKGAYKKRFAVMITSLGIDFNSKGTEYKIEFAPYPHKAYEDEKIQIDSKVENVKTVGEFLGASNSNSIGYLNDLRADPGNNQNILATSATIGALTAQEQKINQQTSDGIGASMSKASAVKNSTSGFAYTINNYNFNLAFNESETPKRTYPDFIKFVIHPDIADSPIVDPGANNLKTLPFKAADISSLDNKKTVLEQKGASFNISKGTSILEVVSQVMRNSKYIQDQLVAPDATDAEKSAAADKPLNWFRVIPSVVITQWDEKVGRYAKTITFYIVPYTVYHTNHPLSAQTVPKGNPFKLYNYYFTGQNSEVLECKVNFDTTYYQNVMLGNANKKLTPGSQTGNQDATSAPPSKYPPLNGVEVGGLYLPVPTVQPRQIKHIVNDQSVASTMDANRDAKTQVAASLHSSLNSDSTGSMLTVKMKIIGDPQYLKQDETLWNPGSVGWVDPSTNKDLFMLTTGSLPFDGGEIYADLFFLTPTDFDPSTGLANPPLSGSKNPYIPTSFSGRFKLIQIESVFSHGKFEQTIEMNRYYDQEQQLSKSMQSNVARTDTSSTSTTSATSASTTTATVAPTPVNNSAQAVGNDGSVDWTALGP
jgi:hypothetical protein